MKKFGIALLLATLSCAAHAQVVVTLDYFFNRESHNVAGVQQRFHYLWEEKANAGFSILGETFTKQGAVLKSLEETPTAANLKGTGIYIIVDPDSKKESPQPNYITPQAADEIAQWVKTGGVLLLLANDSANVELPHFNTLAGKFGMHFNNDLQNHVVDDSHFEEGAIITTGNKIFGTATKVFMKDVCSISVSKPAKAVLLNKDNAIIIAEAKYGKGFVLAVGDPWLYDEYVNGRLPASFENDKAAADIVKYLLSKAKK